MLRLQLEEILLHDFVLAHCWFACAAKGLWHKAAVGEVPFGLAAVGARTFGGTPGGFCSPAQLALYCCGVMEKGEADKGDVRSCAGGFTLFLFWGVNHCAVGAASTQPMSLF